MINPSVLLEGRVKTTIPGKDGRGRMRVLKRIGKAVHKSVAFDSRKYFGKKALKK